MSAARARVLISGKVQGVFFRAYARDHAIKLGLTGWIRNRRDGAVEAVFEGDEMKIGRMIQWCRNGPPGAHVANLEVEWEEPEGGFTSFDIKYGY